MPIMPVKMKKKSRNEYFSVFIINTAANEVQSGLVFWSTVASERGMSLIAENHITAVTLPNKPLTKSFLSVLF